jgi:hypothetical protein
MASPSKADSRSFVGQSALKQQTVSAWANAAVFMVLAAHWSPGLAERPRGMRNAGVIANSNGIRQ